jgi:hypothetical protein
MKNTDNTQDEKSGILLSSRADGIIRHACSAIGGALVGYGISHDVAMELMGAVSTLTAFVWSFYEKRQK